MSTVRKRPASAEPPSSTGAVRKKPAAVVLPLSTAAPAAAAQGACLPEWFDEADSEAQNEVFLVTGAKLLNDRDEPEDIDEKSPPPLKDPATTSKAEFRKALQDSIANPIYNHKRGGRPAIKALELDFYMGVKEG